MSTNVIKQIVQGEGSSQTIKMVVRSNERGPQGEKGDTGSAATIQAGQAYSIPATQAPAVMNSGTEENAVFDFYIPRTSASWGDITGDIKDQPDLAPFLEEAGKAVQPEDINYTVVQDLDVSSNSSTSVMQLDAAKVNLMSGTVSSTEIPLTVASSTAAGVMNSATFNAVSNNSTAINAILNGSVAINNLPASPTQAELTAAWKTATGLTNLINGAKILDITNAKYWTYYTNTELWYVGSVDIQASVSTFTNSSEGIIRGSTSVGQVFAESDGTGSVNGWDALDSRVTNNTNAMLRVGSVLSQPTSVAYVDTANIVDGAVTSDKIDYSSLKKWVPDYANATSILVSGTSTYSMSADGFVSVGLYRYQSPSATDSTITIKINNVPVGYIGSGAVAANGAKTVTYSNLLPVLTGDSVEIQFSGDVAVLSSAYFIPGKWA